ncbi:MAG: hypothetical protein Tsb0021_00320 [Chlamydiales bacterium]
MTFDPLKHERKHESKKPEFINLEDSFYQTYRAHRPNPIPKVKQIKVSFKLRIFSALACIFTFFWTLGGAVLSIIFAIGAALCIFKSSYMNSLLADCWDRVKKGAAVTLGLFTGIFSPQFGITIILCYFMIQEEDIQQTIIGKALFNQLNKESNDWQS